MKWSNKTGWQPIRPEETKSGRVIGYRPVRPSLVFILLVLTMIACCLSILDQLDILRPEMLFVFVGAWSSIAASETDVNSPLNQTLMDKIRENLDYLHAVGGNIIHFHGWNGDDAYPYTIVLEDTIDWRFRYIQVRGLLLAGHESGTDGYTLGDILAYDKKIHSQIAAHGTPSYNAPGAGSGITSYCLFDDWLYSAEGGADSTTEPYLTYTFTLISGVAAVGRIWIDSTTGDLKLTMASGTGSPWRALAYNILVTYSEAQE